MKKIFWWIGVGIFITAGAFFIPVQSGSLWPSVISASVAAFIYVVVFLAVWLPKIQPARKRKAIAVTLTVLLVFSGGSAMLSYESSVRQKERLKNIRTHLEKEIIKSYIQKPMLVTLRGYYNSEYDDTGLGQVFKAKYDSLVTQDSLFTFGNRNENQSIFIYLANASPDTLVLVGESSIVEGKNGDFENYSKEKGRFQVRGILTSNGVDYEREN